MSDIDESSFPKARSLLLAYSGVVLALWFFGAKLEQFQLMGTAIQLNERVDQAWLILALLNLYLLVRYCQRLPEFALNFDHAMNELYDKRLRWAAVRLNQSAMKESMAAMHAASPGSADAARFKTGRAQMACYRKVAASQQRDPSALTIQKIPRRDRTEIILSFDYQRRILDEWSDRTVEQRLPNYNPPAIVTWPIKAFVIMHGAFVTPWFTDYVAPILLGLASSAAAFYMYLRLNHYLWL